MKTIILTNNKVALIDDDDYERLSKYKWGARQRIRRGKISGWDARRHEWVAGLNPKTGKKHTYVRNGKRYFINGYYKNIYMHRFLLNAPSNMEVDHIDGNGLNNQKSNLRLCTPSQNRMNTRTRTSSNTGITGVTWDNQTQKWRATITMKGKMINLGRYKEMKDAIEVRKKAEKEYFKEFTHR
jgi:hypothetical protein